ncbi:hypothetical protein AAV99_11880 [Aurantiacibacter marinus]|uniref:Transglutaminase n=2 Tax=Aurantiacibacter marinus TaxID=874156 RepID=A0A0H0XT01_9SPHN|nr:hypothetical protein AAV99_11880 [Aurantiacibacter marinus]
MASAHASPYSCPVRAFVPAAPASAPSTAATAKSAAILGGQPSALDLIRQQQSGLDAAAEQAPAAFPALHRSLAIAGACQLNLASIEVPTITPSSPVRTGSGTAVVRPIVAAGASADNFLGSARVRIRRTPFTDDWQRVSSQELSGGRVNRLLGAGGTVSTETLSQVNRWANQRIEYADDNTTYGARDYWATAEETLAIGRGDCEDYAILKYQILQALGFDESQMYLTLARDLVRNADHAVLIVRVGQQHYLLDNATDVLLPANISYDYRATMSFNSESAWLHGYAQRPGAQPRQIAYRSDSAVSSALVTGLNR